jgi:type IV pilus assembly protein PilA
MRENGFSLMEILIVIAIIGILVAIALPSYQNYTQRARYAEVTQATLPYKLAVSECYQFTHDLHTCTAGQQGIPANFSSNSAQGLTQSITVSHNGVITARPKTQYGFSTNDTYVLTPVVNQHRLYWQSSGLAVEQGYAK